MSKLAYSIQDAAKATTLSFAQILDAARTGELIARNVDDSLLILASDLQAWLLTKPGWVEVTAL